MIYHEGFEAKLSLSNISGDWENLNPVIKPDGRHTYVMAPVWGTDKIILFGGDKGGANYQNETWEFDFSLNNWTKKITATIPKDGGGFTMESVWGTDNIVLFGGYTGYGWPKSLSNETWVYDLSYNTWNKKQPVNKPSIRYCHSMSTIWGTDKVVLFGGLGVSPYNDTWVYDLSDNNWTRKYPKNSPPAGYSYLLENIWGTDKAVLCDGTGQTQSYEGLWIFDLSDNTWTNMKPAQTLPLANNNRMVSVDGMDKLILFCGTDYTSNLDDVWEYDLSDNTWKNIRTHRSPTPRIYHSITPVDGSRKAFLFGGTKEGNINFNDTWVYTYNSSAKYENGTYISAPFDTGINSYFKVINWSAENTINTSVRFQFRTASTLPELNASDFVGPNGSPLSYYTSPGSITWSGHGNDRWMQYMVYLNTDNVFETPIINNVSILYNNLPYTTLSGPANGSLITVNQPDFIWNFTDLDSVQPSGFQVLIDNDIGFGSIDFDSGVQDALAQHWQFPGGTSYNILPEGTWYWKVRTRDPDGNWSEYTEPWGFLVDTISPSSIINLPLNNGTYNELNTVSGIASDPAPGSGLAKVELAVKRISDNKFWNGSAWIAAKTWILISGTTAWAYNNVNVEWNSGEIYLIFSRATDIATNIEEPGPGIRFIMDFDNPYSFIDSPVNGTYHNCLDSISGRAFDSGGAELSYVQISIMLAPDAKYWNGSAWITTPAWLDANGTSQWSYDSGAVNWETDSRYIVRSRAADKISNMEMPGVGTTFFMDLDTPGSYIDTPADDSFVNSLSNISGWSSDKGGSEIAGIAICIQRLEDEHYWNGFNWSTGESWLKTNNMQNWYYNSSGVTWSSTNAYLIRSRASDRAGNVEIPAYGNRFIFDNEKPESNITYPADNSYLENLDAITGSAVDTGGSGLDKVEIAIQRTDDDRYWTGSEWVPGVTWLNVKGTNTWEYSIGIGMWSSGSNYHFQTKAIDNAGNREVVGPGIDFVYDNEPPMISIVINNGAEFTNTTDVSLFISALDTGSGMESMSFSADGISWTPWIPFSKTNSFILDEPDGTKQVYLNAKDRAGNTARPVFDTIILDTTPPEDILIEINSGDTYTNSRNVNLVLNAKDTVSGLGNMSFSFEGMNWSDTEPFNSTKNIDLPSVEGEHLVYFRIWDRAGNTAEAFDTIIIDTVPPHSLGISINDGAEKTKSISVSLALHAVDDISGVEKMSFSEDGKSWSLWYDYRETDAYQYNLSPVDGEIIIYFRVVDSAGNEAEPVFDTIILSTHSQDEDESREYNIYFIFIIIFIIILIIITRLKIIQFIRRKERKKDEGDAQRPLADTGEPAEVPQVGEGRDQSVFNTTAPVHVPSVYPPDEPEPVPLPVEAPRPQLPARAPQPVEPVVQPGVQEEPVPLEPVDKRTPTGSQEILTKNGTERTQSKKHDPEDDL